MVRNFGKNVWQKLANYGSYGSKRGKKSQICQNGKISKIRVIWTKKGQKGPDFYKNMTKIYQMTKMYLKSDKRYSKFDKIYQNMVKLSPELCII